MGKFVTVLCLLVAVTGIQGSNLTDIIAAMESSETSSTTTISSLMSSITSEMSSVSSSTGTSSILSTITTTSTSGITAFATEAESVFTEMATGFKSALTAATSFESVANATAALAISEMATVVESYSDSNVDLSSCTTLVTEFQTIVSNAIANTTSCASTYVTSLNTEYDATVTAFSDFLQDLYDTAEEANSCSTDFWTYISCIAEVAADITGTSATDFSNVMINATALISDMSKLETELESCGLSSAVTTVQDNLVTYTAEYAECAVNLGASAA
ncbi:bypass of stop codon protein 1-like [Neodiprion fabricii]|uniref:bypass of stop codon protein 1-like n=1 Tax=Neodiprion fabricii TaxID=2872261 RepID=UPI001ED8C0E4|nr:bypass of stop codon protein 1-like [Neodiprion fabricii]